MDENAILNGSMTLDMLYHPQLAHAYGLYQYAIIIFLSFLFSFAIYVILTKSTSEMGIYKMMLINQLGWTYALDLVLTIWQPINIVPYFMAYSAGIARYLGPNGIYAMLYMTYFMYGGLAQSIMLSLIFRVSRLYRTSSFEIGMMWMKIGIGLLMVIELVLAVPVLIWVFTQDATDVTILRQKLSKSQPIISKLFFLEPTLNGFDWTGQQFILNFGCIYYGIGLILFSSFLGLSVVLFVGKMRHLRFHASSSSYKMQIMLFRTLMVQISLDFVTIALPILVLVYMLATKNPYGSLHTQLALFILSFHGITETASMLYFIKPYRNYLISVFKKVARQDNKIVNSAIIFT